MTTWNALVRHFNDGGWGMYPLLVCLVVCVLIGLERAVVLFLRSSRLTPRFEADIKRCILASDLPRAIELCEASRAPAARVVQAGFEATARSDYEVQVAMDLAVLRETPRIARRTPYLSVTANLAVLVGLLGTMTGLVKSTCCCCGGESVDPSQKARILAEGISEAMNCTAFGLIIGILSLIAFACLNGRTQRLEDEMRAMSVHLVGLVAANREKLGLPGTTSGA